MCELTPTEIAAQDLISAADSMGAKCLSGAIGADTERKLRELLQEPRESALAHPSNREGD